MLMQESMRWFGPNDPVHLSDLRQAGCSGVVTSLHQIPYGEIWSVGEIMKRKTMIEDAGMVWCAVESLPVHEDIKTGDCNYRQYIDNYIISLRNLASCGIKLITYNFMPVLDWVRTNLNYTLPDGSKSLFFEHLLFAAFDLFVLKRADAERDYSAETIQKAKIYFDSLSSMQKTVLEQSIVDTLPGCKGQTLNDVKSKLARYHNIDRAALKEHLKLFLNEVCPEADELGCRLVIHPDDPPFSVLGLPRIFSTEEDIRDLIAMEPSPSNGICFCTGSFSGREDNDLLKMFNLCKDRVGFVHLRSTEHPGGGDFYEANHLQGAVNMYEMICAIEEEQIRRIELGRADWRLPMRPDHGHVMLDDLKKPETAVTPGYSAVGRLRALAELRGVEYGVMHALYPKYLKYCELR